MPGKLLLSPLRPRPCVWYGAAGRQAPKRMNVTDQGRQQDGQAAFKVVRCASKDGAACMVQLLHMRHMRKQAELSGKRFGKQ